MNDVFKLGLILLVFCPPVAFLVMVLALVAEVFKPRA